MGQDGRKALPYDLDVVIPGHGPVVKKADLVKWVQTVATIRTRVQKACAGGAIFDRGVPGMCQELSQ
jgi:hypothetical protein